LRLKRIADIKAAAEAKKAEEVEMEVDTKPDMKQEGRRSGGSVSPQRTKELSIKTERNEDCEDDVDEGIDLLKMAALTPRNRGRNEAGEEMASDNDGDDSDEGQPAGDVDEKAERERDLKISPRKALRVPTGPEDQNVYNMFDDNLEAATARVDGEKVINRGDNKMLADNFDDKEGYLTFQMGEIFNDRYQVNKTLGKGVFSTVLGAVDVKHEGSGSGNVAIKVIRNNDMMAKCATKELDILRLLAKDGGAHQHYVVQLTDDFVLHGHQCLVFEPMAMNLREVGKKFGNNRGINIEAVMQFAKQMFIALKHLRKCKIVHADIKPDNILINERHNMIKVCDFGSGSYINECDITPYLVSRWYRAPEITLCLRYDYAIDMWSIGCCIYELYVGKVMFPGNSNNDMLRRFMEIMGRFPNKLIKRSMQKFVELGRPVDFTEDFKFLRVMVDKITKKETVKILTIDEKPTKDLMHLLMPTSLGPEATRKIKQLKELLQGALALNPDNRWSIEECLQSPFLKEAYGYVPQRRAT